MNTEPPLALYVHWPYCARICPYCDFNVRRQGARRQGHAELAAAIVADLLAHADLTGRRNLVSVYFGGGTPSLMNPDLVADIVERAKALWRCEEALELTLEANPTDAETGLFAAFRQAGVNRLSLGVQSFQDRSLTFLGRNHDSAAARRAVEVAQRVFEQVSIDLIYALPGQSAPDWVAELQEAASRGVGHLSAYQLTVETGTAFARAVGRGAWRPLPAEEAATLFEVTQEVLLDAGYDAYEVSNHARCPAARSRHNLAYWRGEDYIGVGPGAHGRLTLEGDRWECESPRAVAAYIAAAPANSSARRRLEPVQVAQERLLMGLRTSEGVSLDDLSPLAIDIVKLESLAAAGLVRIEADRISATAAGRLVLDRIALELASPPLNRPRRHPGPRREVVEGWEAS